MNLEEFAIKCGVVFVQLPKATLDNDTDCYNGRWGYHAGDPFCAEYGYKSKAKAVKGWFNESFHSKPAKIIMQLLSKT